MNYTIQCTDILSGKIGCFGFSTSQYLSEDKKLQFKALTPIFSNLVELFAYAKIENIDLRCETVNWGYK